MIRRGEKGTMSRNDETPSVAGDAPVVGCWAEAPAGSTPLRAAVVWGVALVAYASAVLQRTTMGVAGLEAVDRFQTSASIVSTFVVLQLTVYALAQIPAGLLLDRFGARVTLTTGAALMACGQLLLSGAETVPEAILARIVVGAGDALTFGSAIRLVPAWFPPRRAPLFTQLTGILGQFGQIASAVPFVALLGSAGWSAAFRATAVVAAAAGVLALLLVRPSPQPRIRPNSSQRVTRIPAQIWRILRHPATQLGFWSHYTAGFPGIVFAMMWGYPYLTAGEGLPRTTASAIMTVLVLASIVAGPVIGALTQRHPLRRSTLVHLVVVSIVVPLTATVLWPGPAPLWLLVVLVVGLSIGGPGSGIGFDFPRTDLAKHRLGTATGVVIMGGFVGALIAIQLIGLALDLMRPDGAYDLVAFRRALAVQIPMLLLGVIGMLRSRRRLRTLMAQHGTTVPPWRDVWRSGRWRQI